MKKNAGEALYEFRSRPVSINVRIDERYANLIADLLRGWTVTLQNDLAADSDFEMTAGSGRKITVSGRWVGAGYSVRDEADIACSFIAEALKTQANENTAQFCVHAASAVFEGRAILFAGGFRSGKSTLTAVLASRGLRIIGDDAVFISPQRQSAISAGILPRLRLPLPDILSENTQRFIAKTCCLKGERYMYLALPGEKQMVNAEELSLGAFVFVNRVEGADVEIIDMPKSEALKSLIWQNFARQLPAHQILNSLSDLVLMRRTVELRYDDVEKAADLLIETFSSWPSSDRQDAAYAPNLLDRLNTSEPVWQINPDIDERQLDDGHFIADGYTGRIYYLNSIGAAIWRLLGAGDDADEIAAKLTAAFPDVECHRIRQDVNTMISAYRENGLIFAHEVSPHKALKSPPIGTQLR